MQTEIDHWNLRTLFKFQEPHSIVNDTSTLIKINRFGKDHPIDPGSKIVFNNHDKNPFEVPNSDVVRYSDGSIFESASFHINLNDIISCVIRNLEDGHIINGLKFLDYQYGTTKSKKRFLEFLKYFLIPNLPSNAKTGSFLTNPINDWIKEKDMKRKRPRYLVFITLLILIFVVGAIASTGDIRLLFLGALIGIVSAQIEKLFEIFSENT